jgi:hypothetical protein
MSQEFAAIKAAAAKAGDIAPPASSVPGFLPVGAVIVSRPSWN